jgi:hypothetical protein
MGGGVDGGWGTDGGLSGAAPFFGAKSPTVGRLPPAAPGEPGGKGAEDGMAGRELGAWTTAGCADLIRSGVQ